MVSCCQGNNRGGSDPPWQHGGFYGNLATVHLRALTVTLSDIRELKQRRRRRQRERQKSRRFYDQNNNFSSAASLFCTFLCRHCTTATWNYLRQRFMEDTNTSLQISLSPSKLGGGAQEFNSWEIHQHLRFYNNRNNSDQVWKIANSFK